MVRKTSSIFNKHLALCWVDPEEKSLPIENSFEKFREQAILACCFINLQMAQIVTLR